MSVVIVDPVDLGDALILLTRQYSSRVVIVKCLVPVFLLKQLFLKTVIIIILSDSLVIIIILSDSFVFLHIPCDSPPIRKRLKILKMRTWFSIFFCTFLPNIRNWQEL